MSASTTMTIRVPSDLKDKLGQLAEGTRRSRSYLATEAVTAYVERELAIINASTAASTMSRQGVFSHDQVKADARKLVARGPVLGSSPRYCTAG